MQTLNNKIERSIITTFRSKLYRNFIKAIEEFNLIEENDKIAVCISGGKDSFLLSKLMLEIQKHGKVKFEFINILMNPGYTKKYLKEVRNNAKKLNIELIIFNNDIFEKVKNEQKVCYLCARKRRGALYSKAKELGCNKIALGHHFNDIIETIIMSIVYNGKFKTMLPKVKSTNFENMYLIRPMYYIKEKDIISWMKYNNLVFNDYKCPFSKKNIGARNEVKNIIKEMSKLYKEAPENIMNSTKNVNKETILSYKE